MPTDFVALAQSSKDRLDKFKYKAELESSAIIVDKNDENAYKHLAEKIDIKNDKPEDFILFKSVLCTSLPFVNSNGDAFYADDLVKAVESGQLSPSQPAIVDWRHNFSPYGNTISAEIVDSTVTVPGVDGAQPVKQIVVYSVFYKWLFPYEADKIQEWAENGVLKFSMACGADDVKRLNGTNRVLINPQFIANSIIPPDGTPADENAELITMAMKKDKTKPNNGEKEMEKKIAELEKTISTLQDKITVQDEVIKKHEATKAAKDLKVAVERVAELEKEVASVKDELAKAKSDLEAAASEKEELSGKYEAAANEIKAIREAEVEKINSERATKLAELIESEEDAKFYIEKFKASLDDENKVVANAEEYDRFVALFAGKSKKEDAATAEGKGSVKDAPASESVKATAEAGKVSTKTSKNDDEKPYDWA